MLNRSMGKQPSRVLASFVSRSARPASAPASEAKQVTVADKGMARAISRIMTRNRTVKLSVAGITATPGDDDECGSHASTCTLVTGSSQFCWRCCSFLWTVNLECACAAKIWKSVPGWKTSNPCCFGVRQRHAASRPGVTVKQLVARVPAALHAGDTPRQAGRGRYLDSIGSKFTG